MVEDSEFNIYCPRCGDGPYSGWQVSCAACYRPFEDSKPSRNSLPSQSVHQSRRETSRTQPPLSPTLYESSHSEAEAVNTSTGSGSRSGRSFGSTVGHLAENPQRRAGSLAVEPQPQSDDFDYGKWIHITDENAGTQAEDESSVSSYSPSFASSASAQSSITDFSIHSKFSRGQIMQAVEALILILRDDYDLSLSYRQVFQDRRLNTQKLRQGLRHLFRSFAAELRKEASDYLEHQASQLVRVKARDVAKIITEYYAAEFIADTSKRRQETEDRLEDDSDDDFAEAPINENSIRDITHFRDFLLGSTALLMLRASVKALITIAPERITAQTSHIDAEVDRTYGKFEGNSLSEATQHRQGLQEWGKWLYNGSVRGMEVALIAIGLLEAPLQPGYKRLRWQCTCGDYLFDDYCDPSDSSLSEFIQNVQHIIGAKITSLAGPITGGERFNFRAPSWMSRTMNGFSSTITRSGEVPSQSLPLHQGAQIGLDNMTANVQALQTKTWSLAACMQNGAYGHIPYQDRIEHIGTDKELFAFMRKEHVARHYGRVTRSLSLKCVKGISFVKLRLWADDNVEVREHSLCCTAVPCCECIPPEALVKPLGEEYECNPAGPPKAGPPFGPNLLMHWLTHPECIHEQQTRVLEQMPKRLKGKLFAKINEPVEGWGICYLEGWNQVLIGLLFALALLGSLVFAILWSVFKHDIQGAFGVSSYIIATLGVFMMLRTAGRVIN